MEEKLNALVIQGIREDDLTLIMSGLDALTEKLQETDEDVTGDADVMATLERIFDLRSRLVDLIPAIDVARAGLMPEALKLSFEMEGEAQPHEVEYRKVA